MRTHKFMHMFIMVILILSTFGRSVPPTAAASDWEGRVFVGSSGRYEILNPSTGENEGKTPYPPDTSSIYTGCAFSPDGSSLYGTKIQATKNAPEQVVIWDTKTNDFVKAIPSIGKRPESVTVAENGDIFVGYQYNDNQDGKGHIRKFVPKETADGKTEYELVKTYNVDVEAETSDKDKGGTDWITLSSDQRTIFYTSKGNKIFRYDVVDDKQLEPFIELSSGNKLSALELLEPGDGTGGLIVANYQDIRYIGPDGEVKKYYDHKDGIGGDWSAIAIDSSGKSFWAIVPSENKIYKFDFELDKLGITGTPVLSKELKDKQGVIFNSYGLCVQKQISPKSVTFDGPNVVEIGKEYTFAATVSPHDVTLPLIYTWKVNGEEEPVSAVSRSNAYTFKWVKAYPGPDPIIVSVTVENDVQGGASVTVEKEVTIVEPPDTFIAPEKVEITADDGTPTKTNTPYAFTAKVSPENATAPIEYIWEVTDNGTTTQFDGLSNTQENYSWGKSGTKTITVTAKNAAGESPPATLSFTIPEEPVVSPVVTIYGPTTGQPGMSYDFTALVEPTNTTLPLTYEWVARDGVEPDATETRRETHPDISSLSDKQSFSWDTEGIKKIYVTVTNDTEDIPVDTHEINIIITRLKGVTIEGPTSGELNTPYFFFAKPDPAGADGPITYEWSVQPDGEENEPSQGPDGQVASSDQQSYSWTTGGTKTVTVIAKGLYGEQFTYSKEIVIKAPQKPGPVSCTCPYEYGVTDSSEGYRCDVTVGPAEVTIPLTYACTATDQDTNGQTSTKDDLTHACGPYIWHTPGKKDITVNVSNDAGSAEATCSIDIYKSPADIKLVDPPALVLAGQEYAFTARVTDDETSTPLEYTWNVSNQEDRLAESDLTNTQYYTWDSPGSQTINITAKNKAGERTLEKSYTELEVIAPPDSVTINCPSNVTTFQTNTEYKFTAILSDGATDNFTYTWSVDGDEREPEETRITQHEQTFTWDTLGKKDVSVTVQGRLGDPVSAKALCDIDVQPVLPESIAFIGNPPTIGDQSTDYPFQAQVSPENVTLPLTFAWEWVDDEEHPDIQIGESNSRTASHTQQWNQTCGEKHLKVTATYTDDEGEKHSVTAEHAITINCPNDPYKLYETTHNWIDIRDGIKLDWLTDDPNNNPNADDAMVEVPLPGEFTFGLYDKESIKKLYVSSNGAVLVSPDGTKPADVPKENLALSDNNSLNYLIAPFWDDLDSDIGYVIYKLIGEAPERQFVLEWHARSHHDSNQDDQITFQMILYENHKNIKFQYDDTSFTHDGAEQTEYTKVLDYGKSATVGIRGPGPDQVQHKQYAHNQPKLKYNPALCFQYQYLDDANRNPEPCDQVVALDKVLFTSVPEGCAERDAYELTASVSPTNALRPITYEWFVDGHDPVQNRKNKDGESDIFSFTWDDTDDVTKTVKVQATSGNVVTHTTTVITRSVATLTDLIYRVYEQELIANVTVQLSAACYEPVKVSYGVFKENYDTAEIFEDYELLPETYLRFAPGVSSTPILISLVDDGEKEVTEPITIKLLDPPSNGDYSYITHGYPSQASLHILDSPSPLAKLVQPENMREEEKKTAEEKCQFGFGTLITGNKVDENTNMCVPVKLNRALTEPVTVTCRAYDLENPSPGEYPATQGEDYTIAASNAVVSFALGETIGVCIIDITKDNIYEEDEVFTLTLPEYEHSTNVYVKEKNEKTVPTMNLTIGDDDELPTLSLKPPSMTVKEGDGTVKVVAELSEISTKEVAFTIKVGEVGDTAKAGEDYENLKDDTYDIPAGTKTVTISIEIIDDSLDEGTDNETFTVSILGNSVEHAISQGIPGTIFIEDNDGAPRIQFLTPTYEVGEDKQDAGIQLVRTGDIRGEVTVPYILTNGTARAGVDYIKPKIQTVTFPDMANTATISISVVPDKDTEGDETVYLALGKPSRPNCDSDDFACAPTLGKPDEAILTILDSPQMDTVQLAQATYSGIEDNDKTASTIPITITRTRNAKDVREVTMMVFDATAALGVDYELEEATGCQLDPNDPRSIRVSFSGGQTERICHIKTIPDGSLEGNETFNIVLSAPIGENIGLRNATVTIEDNDVDRNKWGLIEFAVASRDINENEGEDTGKATGDGSKLRKISVQVRRIGGTTGDVNVYCTSVGGSALAAPDEATATSAHDYVYTGEPITFANSGNTEGTCEVLIVDNEQAEGDETLQLNLIAKEATAEGEVPAKLGAQKTMSIKILDDDIDPDSDTSIVQFSEAKYRFSEGTDTKACSAEAVIKLTRFGGLKHKVTVFYETLLGGTASHGIDYTPQNGTLMFDSNQSEASFTIPLCGDADPEGPETVLLKLDYADDTHEHIELGSQSEATLFIEDSTLLDPNSVLVFFSEPVYSVVEGDFKATIQVERRGNADALKDMVLYWRDVPESAKPDADYKIENQQLSFLENETNATLEVAIKSDTVDEGNERLGLQLFFADSQQKTCPADQKGENADKTDNTAYDCDKDVTVILGQPNAVLMIQDVPSGPVLFFSEPEYVIREDRGEAIIPIMLTGAITDTITVSFRTNEKPPEPSVPGAPVVPHAEAGVDYEPVNGIITFKPGDTHYLTEVVVIDRDKFQIDRLVRLELTNATGGAKLGTQKTATLRIVDKSELEQGVLQFATHSYFIDEESDANNQVALVKVLRTKGTKGPVCVDYDVMNGSALVITDIISGTIGSDQSQAMQSSANNVKETNTIKGQICFADGEDEKTITLTAIDDKDVEGKEFVVVVLREPTNGAMNGAVIGPQITTVVNIQDSDIPPGGIVSFVKDRFRINEADEVAYVTVQREGHFTNTISVDYATFDSYDFPAHAGVDYHPITRTLTFSNTNPPTTELTFPITITNDSLFEGIEFIDLRLSNPTGDSAIGTVGRAYLVIEDDDILPGQSVIQFGEPTYTANEGSIALLTVLRTGNLGKSLTLNYDTIDGTAHADADYLGITKGTMLTFADGQSYASITVTLHTDNEVEAYEDFQVRLSNQQLVNPGPSDTVTLTNERATVRIIDGTYSEYGVFQFVPEGYPVVEGNVQKEIVVMRTGGTKGTVTVDFMVEDDLARGGTNYEPAEDTLTFGEKVSTQSFFVPIKDDDIIEGDQDIKMYLQNPQGGATVPKEKDYKGILTIKDNDIPAQGLLQFAKSSYPAREDDDTVTVYVERKEGYEGDVIVDYTILDAGAVLCDDYYQPGTNTQQACYGASYPATGKLTFKGGKNPDTTQSIMVPLHDDDIYEKKPDEVFYVVLSNARTSDGKEVTVRTPNIAVVTIGDEEPFTTYARFVEKTQPLDDDGVDVPIELTEVCQESVTVTYTIQIGDKATKTYSYTFAARETMYKVPVPNDIKCDKQYKRINLKLVGVSGGCGVKLGMQDDTELTYESNEVCPALVYLPLIAGGKAAKPQDNPVAPFALTITPNPIVVSSENSKAKCTVTLNDAEGKVLPGEVVTFSTDSPTIVAFDGVESITSSTSAGGIVSNDKITCRSRGTANIVVSTRDGQGGTAQEKVNVTCMDAVPDTIKMEPVSADARLGTPINLTAKVLEANGNTVTAGKQVTFKVDLPLNPSIQKTVGTTTTNSNGIATLLLPNDELWAGKFTVTASTKNDKEKTGEVELTADACDENADLLNTVCRGEIEDAGDSEENETIYEVTIPATNENNPGASKLVTLTVFLRGIPEGANYDMELRTSRYGDVMETSDKPSNYDETVSMELSPGTYYIAVQPKEEVEETNEYFLGAIVEE